MGTASRGMAGDISIASITTAQAACRVAAARIRNIQSNPATISAPRPCVASTPPMDSSLGLLPMPRNRGRQFVRVPGGLKTSASTMPVINSSTDPRHSPSIICRTARAASSVTAPPRHIY
jgi:hypothetical protein